MFKVLVSLQSMIQFQVQKYKFFFSFSLIYLFFTVT